MKGFKDKSGKFRPTGSKTKSSLKKSDVRKKETVQYHTPDSDTKFYGEIKQDKITARRIGEEIDNEKPKVLEMLQHQKGYHEDAMDMIDKITKTIENKAPPNGNGYTHLPHEYTYTDDSDIDDLIRDWASIDSDGYNHSGSMQNDLIASDMSMLRDYVNKIEAYKSARASFS